MYQRPEILEIGHAERLTLGTLKGVCDDACECVRECEVDIGLDTAWPPRRLAPVLSGTP
jgi:hypothetical protein